MPAKLDRCVEQVKEKGYSEDRAYAICTAALKGEAMPDGTDEGLWKEITAPDLPGINLVPTKEVKKTTLPDSLNLFIPITKIDLERREVWGFSTKEEPDNSNEIMDYASSKPYFSEWSQQAHKRSGGKSRGNLRSMHQAIAAGKLIDLRPDDATKGIYIGARVVDDDEWHKVQEGVYTGFSVGGKYIRRWPDYSQPGLIRYTAQPAEISLVDAPCVSSATFDVVKAGGTEQRLFKADGQGEHKTLIAQLDSTLPDTAIEFSYEGDGIKFSLSKAANNELIPPEAIEAQVLPWDVAGQQVEQVQPDFKPKELPANPESIPTGVELSNAGAPAISMESTAAPIVVKVVKIKSMKKVKVIAR